VLPGPAITTAGTGNTEKDLGQNRTDGAAPVAGYDGATEVTQIPE
jgi:hypothetical protein